MKTKIAAVVVCVLGFILFVMDFLSTDLLTYLVLFILAPLAVAGLILHKPKENLPHLGENTS